MNIEIREIEYPKDLVKFIRFQEKLYKDHPMYIPPIRKSELKTLDLKINPVGEFCEAKYWLAYQDRKIVGRIAGIINHRYNEKVNKKLARFGWLDFIEDNQVLQALLNTAESWAREKGMEYIHGPLGFTSFDASGVLVEGFDEMPTSFAHYNYPYYDKMLKKNGYEKEIDWIEFRIKVPEKVPEKIPRLAKLIEKRYGLKEVELKSKADILKYVDDVFKILNAAYEDLFAFNKLSPAQMEILKKEYLSILQPDYCSFVINSENELVAFGITTPSLAHALQRAKGKLYPFGIFKVFKALKKNTVADLLLIGVRPDYRDKGLVVFLFRKIMTSFIKNGIKYVETTRELEHNNRVQQLWSNYEYRQHKRARCYIKKI